MITETKIAVVFKNIHVFNIWRRKNKLSSSEFREKYVRVNRHEHTRGRVFSDAIFLSCWRQIAGAKDLKLLVESRIDNKTVYL